MAVLLFQERLLYKISGLPGKFDIKTFYTLAKKCLHILIPVKDGLGLKVGVYSIPCEHGKVCIGQTGQSIEIAS
jgi:hypothetical protein